MSEVVRKHGSEEVTFKKRLEGEEDWVIKDHILEVGEAGRDSAGQDLAFYSEIGGS